MFLQMMVWYLQLKDPKLIPVAVPPPLRSGFIAVDTGFFQSFKQPLFFSFGHLFHNLKAFPLPAIFKWFWVAFATFYSCTAPGLSYEALLI